MTRFTGFPLGLESLENGKAFPSQGRVEEFEKTGKVGENHTKYWKTEGISEKLYLLFSSVCPGG